MVFPEEKQVDTFFDPEKKKNEKEIAKATNRLANKVALNNLSSQVREDEKNKERIRMLPEDVRMYERLMQSGAAVGYLLELVFDEFDGIEQSGNYKHETKIALKTYRQQFEKLLQRINHYRTGQFLATADCSPQRCIQEIETLAKEIQRIIGKREIIQDPPVSSYWSELSKVIHTWLIWNNLLKPGESYKKMKRIEFLVGTMSAICTDLANNPPPQDDVTFALARLHDFRDMQDVTWSEKVLKDLTATVLQNNELFKEKLFATGQPLLRFVSPETNSRDIEYNWVPKQMSIAVSKYTPPERMRIQEEERTKKMIEPVVAWTAQKAYTEETLFGTPPSWYYYKIRIGEKVGYYYKAKMTTYSTNQTEWWSQLVAEQPKYCLQRMGVDYGSVSANENNKDLPDTIDAAQLEQWNIVIDGPGNSSQTNIHTEVDTYDKNALATEEGVNYGQFTQTVLINLMNDPTVTLDKLKAFIRDPYAEWSIINMIGDQVQTLRSKLHVSLALDNDKKEQMEAMMIKEIKRLFDAQWRGKLALYDRTVAELATPEFLQETKKAIALNALFAQIDAYNKLQEQKRWWMSDLDIDKAIQAEADSRFPEDIMSDPNKQAENAKREQEKSEFIAKQKELLKASWPIDTKTRTKETYFALDLVATNLAESGGNGQTVADSTSFTAFGDDADRMMQVTKGVTIKTEEYEQQIEQVRAQQLDEVEQEAKLVFCQSVLTGLFEATSISDNQDRDKSAGVTWQRPSGDGAELSAQFADNSLAKKYPDLGLFADMTGVGNANMSDKTIATAITVSKELAIQVALTAVAWWIGGFVARRGLLFLASRAAAVAGEWSAIRPLAQVFASYYKYLPIWAPAVTQTAVRLWGSIAELTVNSAMFHMSHGFLHGIVQWSSFKQIAQETFTTAWFVKSFVTLGVLGAYGRWSASLKHVLSNPEAKKEITEKLFSIGFNTASLATEAGIFVGIEKTWNALIKPSEEMKQQCEENPVTFLEEYLDAVAFVIGLKLAHRPTSGLNRKQQEKLKEEFQQDTHIVITSLKPPMYQVVKKEDGQFVVKGEISAETGWEVKEVVSEQETDELFEQGMENMRQAQQEWGLELAEDMTLAIVNPIFYKPGLRHRCINALNLFDTSLKKAGGIIMQFADMRTYTKADTKLWTTLFEKNWRWWGYGLLEQTYQKTIEELYHDIQENIDPNISLKWEEYSVPQKSELISRLKGKFMQYPWVKDIQVDDNGFVVIHMKWSIAQNWYILHKHEDMVNKDQHDPVYIWTLDEINLLYWIVTEKLWTETTAWWGEESFNFTTDKEVNIWKIWVYDNKSMHTPELESGSIVIISTHPTTWKSVVVHLSPAGYPLEEYVALLNKSFTPEEREQLQTTVVWWDKRNILVASLEKAKYDEMIDAQRKTTLDKLQAVWVLRNQITVHRDDRIDLDVKPMTVSYNAKKKKVTIGEERRFEKDFPKLKIESSIKSQVKQFCEWDYENIYRILWINSTLVSATINVLKKESKQGVQWFTIELSNPFYLKVSIYKDYTDPTYLMEINGAKKRDYGTLENHIRNMIGTAKTLWVDKITLYWSRNYAYYWYNVRLKYWFEVLPRDKSEFIQKIGKLSSLTNLLEDAAYPDQMCWDEIKKFEDNFKWDPKKTPWPLQYIYKNTILRCIWKEYGRPINQELLLNK